MGVVLDIYNTSLNKYSIFIVAGHGVFYIMCLFRCLFDTSIAMEIHLELCWMILLSLLLFLMLLIFFFFLDFMCKMSKKIWEKSYCVQKAGEGLTI